MAFIALFCTNAAAVKCHLLNREARCAHLNSKDDEMFFFSLRGVISVCEDAASSCFPFVERSRARLVPFDFCHFSCTAGFIGGNFAVPQKQRRPALFTHFAHPVIWDALLIFLFVAKIDAGKSTKERKRRGLQFENSYLGQMNLYYFSVNMMYVTEMKFYLCARIFIKIKCCTILLCLRSCYCRRYFCKLQDFMLMEEKLRKLWILLAFLVSKITSQFVSKNEQ